MNKDKSQEFQVLAAALEKLGEDIRSEQDQLSDRIDAFEVFIRDYRAQMDRNDKINTRLERQLDEFTLLNAVERMGKPQDESRH